MKRMTYMLTGLMLLALLAPVAWAQETQPKPMPESYQVLRDKTMFSRQHVRPKPPPYRPPPPPAKPKPPVLIGIIRERSGPLAVFETPATGGLAQYSLGEVVPGEYGGTISDMTLDFVEIAGPEKDQVRKVHVGENLEGEGVMLPATAGSVSSSDAGGSSSSGTAGTAPAGGTPPAAGDASSILERLRARRQQQLNR